MDEEQSFYNKLIEVFGIKCRRVASFEEPTRLLRTMRNFIDLRWKGVLLVALKSVGCRLTPAKQQSLDRFHSLREATLG